jgi:hypothetical protein
MSANFSALSQFSWVKSVTITPNNSTNIDASGLYIEGAGTITVEYEDGSTDLFNVLAHTTLPCTVRKVRATGTTATGIHALY